MMTIIVEEDYCCTVYRDGARPFYMEGLCYRELNDYKRYCEQATMEYAVPGSSDVIRCSADVIECVVEGGDAFYKITPGGNPEVEKKEKMALFLEVLDNENDANNVYSSFEQDAQINGYDITTKRDEQKRAIAMVLSKVSDECDGDNINIPYIFDRDLNIRIAGLDYSRISPTYVLNRKELKKIRTEVSRLLGNHGRMFTFNYFAQNNQQ